MKKEKVFITRRIPEKGIELLQKQYEVEVWSDEEPIPRDILLSKIQNFGGLVCMLSDKIDKELMDQAPKLKVIANYAVGFDNIDVKYASKKGIKVGNTPGVLTETTADLAFSLLMAASRRITEAVEYVKAGKWHTWGPRLLLGYDVWGSTLGVIGFGRIGQAMARRGLGFGMKVLYHSRTPKPEAEEAMDVEYASLDEIYSQSDYISLHINLNESSKGLIDKKALNQMKSNCILINTARGAVINTEDLIDALETSKIAGAGLDVTDPEPIPSDSKLLKLNNCIVVPHIGSASYATRSKMSVMAAENVIAALSGETLPYEVK
ncbi:MAG: glyoxylate reductase [Thermotogaceae bacterium]|nr:glyoxylate reductase [Thermotogaceae bacterium]